MLDKWHTYMLCGAKWSIMGLNGGGCPNTHISIYLQLYSNQKYSIVYLAIDSP